MVYIGNALQNEVNHRRFIRYALKYADCIGVSYTSDYSAFEESGWYELWGESIIAHEYDERGVLILFLKIDHSTVNWIKSKTNIFDFMQSEDGEFLWDLCLYKDESEVFSTVTHEKMAYISEEMWQEYNSKSLG